MQRDVAAFDLETFQPGQVQSQHHAFGPLGSCALDDSVADAEGAVDVEEGFLLFGGHYDLVGVSLGRDLELGRRISAVGEATEQADHGNHEE